MSAGRFAGSWIAGGSLALMVALLLYLCGRPLATSDLWWHLAMGEVYATQGLWPAADPLLHTAHADAPIQHEWLFEVVVHAVDRWLGFQGLRVLHVLSVAGILALAYSIFRRRSRSREAAAFATALFVALASWRLVQLRPDLVSIAATLLLYRLLLEPDEPPSWRRVGASLALLLVWVNAHSLFAVGVLLLGAGLAGSLLHAWLAGRLGPDGRTAGERERLRVRRLASALALGLVVTLLNPRGIAQHLTFFTSTRDAAIWEIADEWMPFDPLSWRDLGNSVGPAEWLLTDLALGGFLALAALALWRLWRRPTPSALGDAAPVLASLGLAASVAALASVRFLWLAAFPILFVLSTEPRWTPRGGRVASWALCAASVLLALGYPAMTTPTRYAPEAPRSLARYVSSPMNEFKFQAQAVRFLEETGLEGNLFNTYRLGGYLAYRLAPRLRTFVDSRTEHYPASVYREYVRITQLRGDRPGESFRDLLDRRNVDVFFGVGIPPTRPGRRFTSAHLERTPGWLLVSRSIRHGIYLRIGERNRENLRRVVAYYRREGVPFDPERGLDVMSVLRERPDWALAHGVVRPEYPQSLRDRSSDDAEVRFRALAGLGRSYTLLGAYEAAIEADREAATLRPRAKAPRRRLVYALLRLGQVEQGLEAARALLALDPGDPHSIEYAAAARELQRRGSDAGEAPAPPEALLNRLTL